MSLEQLLHGVVADAGPDPLTPSNGAAYPPARASTGNLPGQTLADAAMGFAALDAPSRWEPPQQTGGPYVEKGAKFYGVKSAAHAHDRMEERTDLPRSHVDKLQRAVDSIGLTGGFYYLPLRQGDKLQGYAAFKSVPDRKGPVLATVLAPFMTPKGQNIEHLVKLAGTPETNASPWASGLFTTDDLDPRGPDASNLGVQQPIAGGDLGNDQLVSRMFDGLRIPSSNTIDTAMSDFPVGGLGP